MPKKRQRKQESDESSDDDDAPAPDAASSSDAGAKIGDYSSVIRKTTHAKKKVLVLCSRGVTSTNIEMVEDLLKLLPHGRKDPKFSKREPLTNIAEVAELAGCKLALYFEARKRSDLYLWAADVASKGPSAKFLVEKVKPMGDTRLSGNCLLGSRPVLSFDACFASSPHWQLLRHLLTTVFSIPKGHPRSKPFHDHVMSFTVVQGRIVVRHYQVVPPLHDKKKEEESLVEIGPRLTLVPIRIFGGTFGGDTLYANGKYVSPNDERAARKRKKGQQTRDHVQQKAKRRARIHEGADQLPPDGLEDVFDD
jgi:ribosome biogenesis protein BRX1